MGGINLQFTRQGTFFGAVWKYVSFHARRNVGATCSFVSSEMNVSFLLTETRLGDIRFQKWEEQREKRIRALAITRSSAVPFQRGQKFTGENKWRLDNWRCAHSFCGLWHLGCIMRALFIAYQGRRRPGALSLLFFITTDDENCTSFQKVAKVPGCLTSLDNPVFLDSHSFFSWPMPLATVNTCRHDKYEISKFLPNCLSRS